jgi:hypothetical protein
VITIADTTAAVIAAVTFHHPLSYCCPATIFRDVLALFLAGSERLRDNRRMMDAAHDQHSETRRPSDRDRIVTTGPSRFQPARPEVLR